MRARLYFRPCVESLEDRLTPSTLFVNRANPQSGDGSLSNPFKTIGQASAIAQAGDIVQVASGTYNEAVLVQNSGTAGAPVRFMAAPGASVIVTGQANGFKVSGKTWINIEGFQVQNTTSFGIYVLNSSFITISKNEVSLCGEPVAGQTARGIKFTNVTNSWITDNRAHHNTDAGIDVSGTSSGISIIGNESYSNARGFERAAAGIDVRSPDNFISTNITHHNEDTGIQIYSDSAATTASTNNLIVNNIIYANGDHGIDVLRSPGQRIINNSVYNNVTAGINVEGNSTGVTLANNISVDNGIDSPRTRGNIRVETGSTAGASLDYDLVFLSVASQVMIVWGDAFYTSLGAFVAATGMESRGVQADPRWAAAAAGDFHLRAGSPAIDSANSGLTGWPANDFEGRARVNDPNVADTGAGLVTYADRGALEFVPAPSNNTAPVSASQSLGAFEDTARAITLSATDVDGDLLTYRIISGPSHGLLSPLAGAGLTYTPAANYYGPDSFTFVANDGLVDSNIATVSLNVTPVNDPPVASDLSVSSARNTSVASTVSAFDVEGDPLTFVVAKGPRHGRLTLNASGSFTYRPNTGYVGPDHFTFRARDAQAFSNKGTVRITVG